MTTTSARGPRGPYARTAQRRAAIAGAVFDLVVEKGYEQVTTSEVATRAAASEATVLYHYPSKEHLLVAALVHAEEAASEPWLTPDRIAEHLPENLRAHLNEWAPSANLIRLYTLLAAQAATPGHPAGEYFTGRYARSVEFFADIVRHRQSAGLAHPGVEPADVARQFLAAWDGLQAQWLLDRSIRLGDLVVDAFRRLSGQNWMEARAQLLDPRTGL
jgi:AcrR family transcriptional regulator